jgi:uncharacterized protein
MSAMSEAKGQHEPSMEEILASIRRIIAEDGDAAPAPAAAEKPAAREEEVLELTEVVEEDGTVVSLTPGAAKKPAPEPPPKRAAEPPESPPARVELEPEPEPVRPPPPVPPSERLVSGVTAAASVAAMSQLAALGNRGDQLGSVSLGDANRTLLDVVRELLRPMLKDWLDASLPQIVERLVQEEIKRVAREAQNR